LILSHSLTKTDFTVHSPLNLRDCSSTSSAVQTASTVSLIDPEETTSVEVVVLLVAVLEDGV
jgi:hypothetical protein